MDKYVISSLFFVTFTTLPLLIQYLFRLKYKKLIKSIENQEESNSYFQCIFINMKQFNCKPHLIEQKECGENCSLAYEKTISSFISSAKQSISMCMFMLSLKQIIYALIDAHRRGVKVRVITDRIMLETNVMKLNFAKLKRNGISYKVQPTHQSMMHHKFCLIDKDDGNLAKMFFGSLNLTTQALTKNFDSVVLTNSVDIIGRFSEEFEELWTHFS